MPGDELSRLTALRANLERRALIYKLTRDFFFEQGFLEVETPVRVPALAPEQYIVPFESEGWYLSTSPELYMKRLLAAGYERLFQMSRCFRRGERGRWHNPEFTMLEWYRAGAGYMHMLEDTERLVVRLAERLDLSSRISYQGQQIKLTLPWRRVTVREAFLQAAGWDPIADPDPEHFDMDLVGKVVPAFPPGEPVMLMDYPAPMASLARLKPGNSQAAERAEVFVGGLELANAYSELTDYDEQVKRFREEIGRIQEQGRRVQMPGAFLESLRHLPQCGGIALGMDRLVMLLCDAASIDEVVPFTVDTA